MDLFDIVAARAGGSGGSSTPQVQADWEQNDSTKVDYIKNKILQEKLYTLSLADLENQLILPDTSLNLKVLSRSLTEDTTLNGDPAIRFYFDIWGAVGTSEEVKPIIDLPLECNFEPQGMLEYSVKNILDFTRVGWKNPLFGDRIYFVDDIVKGLIQGNVVKDYRIDINSNSTAESGYKIFGISIQIYYSFAGTDIRTSFINEMAKPIFDTTTHLVLKYEKHNAPIIESSYIHGG